MDAETQARLVAFLEEQVDQARRNADRAQARVEILEELLAEVRRLEVEDPTRFNQ